MPESRSQRARDIRSRLFGAPRAPHSPSLPVIEETSDLAAEFAFGDVWSRPGLEIKTRSLITIALLSGLYRTDQLRLHINGALNLGITPEEIIEAIFHAGAYAGLPTNANGTRAAREVFRERGIIPGESAGN